VPWPTGLAVYFTIWWVVLFAVLPWGVRRDEAGPAGSEKGAPEKPRLGLKAAVTTVVSAVIWLAIYALVVSDLLSFREQG
jgi:predicted secreted protein